MGKLKYYFLASSMILVFMGAMLKLEHYSNYRPSFMAGIANFFVFFLLYMADRKKKNARALNK